MRIGIDLGGTKIEVIAISNEGVELYRKRVDTPKGDYQQTLEAITQLVLDAEVELGEKGSVGIGIPGTISPYTGTVKNANSTWIIAQPLDKDLSKMLNRPVRISNDANCLAVSEATDGAGAGERVVFAVIIGTGCGAGLAIDGVVHNGGSGVAGEWGHNPMPWINSEELDYAEKVPCYCGRKGCIETFISGTGFCRDYEMTSGNTLKGNEIVALAEKGDSIAEAVLQRYEQRVAKALAHVVNILDPDVIVLGGGASNIDRLYDTLPALLESHVFGSECKTPIRKAVHGDSSGVRGAAWLWPTKTH